MKKAKRYIGIAAAGLIAVWGAAMTAEFLRSKRDFALWLLTFAVLFGTLYIVYRVTLALRAKRAESLFGSFSPEEAEVRSYLSSAITWLIVSAGLVGAVLFDVVRNGQSR